LAKNVKKAFDIIIFRYYYNGVNRKGDRNMKERITRDMIEKETWSNEEFRKAWDLITYWGESNIHILNREWKTSDETSWEKFIIDYAKEI